MNGPSETLVYIFNMSEDVWPFISAMSDNRTRLYEIEENVYLSDLRLFLFAGESGEVVFVSPTAISSGFYEYFQTLFGTKKIQFLVPKRHSGVICEDILEDRKLTEALVARGNGSKRLTVTSYSSSLQFLHLVGELKKKGLTVYTPEAPEEEDAWAVNFYGSKSGMHQLAGLSRAVEPDFQMPEGLICMGIEDAAKIAAKRYIKEHGVVVKTNKGHAGMGLLIFREGDLPAVYADCEQAILTILKKESYWQKFPIIIEDFIPQSISVGGGCPNVEFKIMKTGRVDFLYYCAMRMTSEGVFRGVEIHNDVVSDRVAAQMVDTGFFIGEKLASAGYRGYYDVDFIAGKNGQLYVTESNVRSTGGTFVYAAATALFGKDFMYTTYLLSNNTYDISHLPPQTFASIRQRLTPLLFDKTTKEGLIILSENMLRMGKFAYLIFAPTKKRAGEIEGEMEKLLE